MTLHDVPVTMRGAWRFYQLLGLMEITLTAVVVWFAWTWPRERLDA